MGVEENVLPSAVTYFQIVATPSILIALMFVLGSVFKREWGHQNPYEDKYLHQPNSYYP
jgi:hypothetical protein